MIPALESPFGAIVPLPRAVPCVLAVGAFLKNTICATLGDRAYVSKPIGNLDNAQDIATFEANIRHLCETLGMVPLMVAHDLHPDFHSTRHAQSLGRPLVPVQHHHAHTAALAAEHGIDEPLLGIALDGFGLGPGNQSWGGELIWMDGPEYRRLGHFALMAQPGGDTAAREPWRMAAAALHRLDRTDQIAARYSAQRPAAMLGQVLQRGINCPPTSSAGRLFDAACGLLGIQAISRFEGEAPMMLEAMATAPEAMENGWTLTDGVLDFLPLLECLSECEPVRGANLFHGTLIAGLAEWTRQAAKATGARHVALGGGCFLNKVLTAGLAEALRARGLNPLLATQVVPGDAGLSLGQAWIAALTAAKEIG